MTRIEKLIHDLADKLTEQSALFLVTGLNESEKLNEVITLIISAYVSSMIATLKMTISDQEENDVNEMNKLCSDILQSFQKLSKIGQVRPITVNAIN